ncbi:unnamed protein product [Penicillium salamii]|uniref:Uncharacterized protein n=1 Tax=Penicillium salamii TaxID=1612424 RepID=A0A9W4IXM5_9EURO|nr:hypothetical protein HAV15_012137 [Penicillium sp. str. \
MVDGGPAAVLEPTFTGYVATTQDALLLFEACLTGNLHRVPRRPYDRERRHLVRSGSVFIYDGNSSGIKRWTDGIAWSPSRILGNFLVYRELGKQFATGEKKRALKKATRRPAPAGRPGDPSSQQHGSQGSFPTSLGLGPLTDRSSHLAELERGMVGSLLDSYDFKDSGLVKKTMSVTVSGVTHHLVSYYSMHDVVFRRLNQPSMDASLCFSRPRNELIQEQSFRYPIDDLDATSAVRNDQPSHTALDRYRPQDIASPTKSMQTPVLDFYIHSGPYAISHSPQLDTIPGSLTGAPMADQPAPNLDFSHSPPTVIPPKNQAHHSLYAWPYVGNMDLMSTHSAITSSIPGGYTGVHLSTLSDRNISNSDHSPSAYRKSSFPWCNQATDVPSSVDPSTPSNYFRGSFSMASQFEQSYQASERKMPDIDPNELCGELDPIHPSYYRSVRPE